jgi:tetratricopeptide (TPR) repeat protein
MDERFTYLVEKYLDDTLTEKEKEEFRKYLDDPLCEDYLAKATKAEKLMKEGFRLLNTEADDFQKNLNEDIERYGQNISNETRETVRQMHQNMLNRKKKIRLFSYAAIAASLLIGLVFTWVLYPKQTPQMLYKQYYTTYEYLIARGASKGDRIYSGAIGYYMEGLYDASSKMCQEFFESQPSDPEVHFLYALNLLQMDSLQSALEQFNAAASFSLEKDSFFYVSVYWYKSLCYLAMGDTDAALRDLDKLKGVEKGSVQKVDVEGVMEGIRKLGD